MSGFICCLPISLFSLSLSFKFHHIFRPIGSDAAEFGGVAGARIVMSAHSTLTLCAFQRLSIPGDPGKCIPSLPNR